MVVTNVYLANKLTGSNPAYDPSLSHPLSMTSHFDITHFQPLKMTTTEVVAKSVTVICSMTSHFDITHFQPLKMTTTEVVAKSVTVIYSLIKDFTQMITKYFIFLGHPLFFSV